MARMRPRRWRGHGETDGGSRGGRPDRARPDRVRPSGRPPASGREGAEQGEIIARLERLESLVAAIAGHLGIETAPRQSRAWRPGPRRGAAPAPARTEDHTVVKTVARRLSGRLKLYHADRGYGFVVSPDLPGDVFFHRSDCRIDPASLEPSSPVTFDLVEMANGQSKAVSLTPGRPTAGPAER